MRRYRKHGLVSRVQQAGFVVEQARYVDALAFAASLAFRAYGNRSGDVVVGKNLLVARRP